MARTKNSLNKPKFAFVKLEDLCNTLQSNTLIPVCIKFAAALNVNTNVNPLDSLINQANNIKRDKDDKIEFSITS